MTDKTAIQVTFTCTIKPSATTLITLQLLPAVRLPICPMPCGLTAILWSCGTVQSTALLAESK